MARKFAQGPTVRGTRVELNIPFSGFYESKWSGMVDHAEEMECEYNADERQEEEGIPKELRLSSSEYFDILYRHTDYSAAYAEIAKDYAELFCIKASETIGFKLNAKWSEMVSPREYNFTTDRLFVTVSKTTVKRLFAMSKRDAHGTLARTILDRFTSYSGFHSHYKNDLASWLEVPLCDWDENEVGTLFLACLEIGMTKDGITADEMDWEIYEGLSDHDYEYWSNAVDWPKVEADVAEAREEKAAELRADDPDYVEPPVRCDQTPDLFR